MLIECAVAIPVLDGDVSLAVATVFVISCRIGPKADVELSVSHPISLTPSSIEQNGT